MIGAYSELYLDDAMRNMGEMTEFVKAVFDMSLDTFFHMFVVSGYADRWEAGDSAVLSGMSGTELCFRVLERCGMEPDSGIKALVRYETDETYWAGYFLAYYQWKKKESFSRIFSCVKEKDLFRLYPALHTASEEKGVEVVDRLMKERSQVSRLQEYRKRLGLSQQQLAESSGVNLRTLQEYEVGRKDIRKAAADTVFALAGTLGCKPEMIL